jgi:hypothetical protein
MIHNSSDSQLVVEQTQHRVLAVIYDDHKLCERIFQSLVLRSLLRVTSGLQPSLPGVLRERKAIDVHLLRATAIVICVRSRPLGSLQGNQFSQCGVLIAVTTLPVRNAAHGLYIVEATLLPAGRLCSRTRIVQLATQAYRAAPSGAPTALAAEAEGAARSSSTARAAISVECPSGS